MLDKIWALVHFVFVLQSHFVLTRSRDYCCQSAQLVAMCAIINRVFHKRILRLPQILLHEFKMLFVRILIFISHNTLSYLYLSEKLPIRTRNIM